MFISSEVCFLAVLIVVYIRYEITQSLASFFLVFPSPPTSLSWMVLAPFCCVWFS